MKTKLDQKIQDILNLADRMFLATSVGRNPSGASVFFAQDGDDLIFFTFNPSRKAEQIKFNPRVHAVIWPKNQEGIRGLQIDGECYQIKDEEEKKKAYRLVLETTEAFKEFMDDDFLKANNVVGYYRLKPTTIKYVDFYAKEKFEWKSLPENQTPPLKMAWKMAGKQLGLWVRAVRAPFLTATFAAIFIGAALAWSDLKSASMNDSWSWAMFLLVLLGASLAQIATNTSNDYFDHTSNADEINKVPSPFNGGSRVIQSGLVSAETVLVTSIVSIIGTVIAGFYINYEISGSVVGNTPVLWMGILGVILSFGYTADPVRFAYKGLGEFAIALGFGPLMVMGAHYVLTEPIHHNNLAQWNWPEALVASVPIGILVMLIVWINQFQDTPADAAAGKRTWVVRTAVKDKWYRLEKPLRLYKQFMILAFVGITIIGILGVFTNFGTPYAFVALLPLAMAWKAFKLADKWMLQWNDENEDRQKVPYKLLMVNVLTIGIHFLVGVLLSVAYLF